MTSVYLSRSEYQRIRAIGERALEGEIVGPSTMIRIAVQAFLGDPLEPWAEQLLRDLVDA